MSSDTNSDTLNFMFGLSNKKKKKESNHRIFLDMPRALTSIASNDFCFV